MKEFPIRWTAGLTVALLTGLLHMPLTAEIEIRKGPAGRIVLSNSSPIMAARRSRPVASTSSAVNSVYQQQINDISSVYGVDPRLVNAICQAESAFNPRAVSKKGAVGLMQLMSDTARQYGVLDRTDPAQNLTAGIRHLKYLQDKYQSLPLTLAAYNAGEEPVRKYRGVPPYAETRGYVKRVMSLLGLSYDGLGAKTRVYMYRQPNGRILLTDRVMPTNRGYRSLK